MILIDFMSMLQLEYRLMLSIISNPSSIAVFSTVVNYMDPMQVNLLQLVSCFHISIKLIADVHVSIYQWILSTIISRVPKWPSG
jgi:hypothetical protein